MITYVDTSTLLKLVVEEPGSGRAATIWDLATAVVSTVLVEAEARAALAAARRAGRLSSSQHRQAKQSLALLVDQLDLVEVDPALVATAGVLAEEETLRGYDAVHLASALLVTAQVLTSADRDLLAAATRRGLAVADPTPPPGRA